MSVKTENRNLWFDLIRGLSALAVCADHLRQILLVDYDQVANPWPGLKFFYAATSMGREAVMVFFVLSGYFVGGSVVGRGCRFQWGDYVEARLTRLWVVLIPALVLTLGLDIIAWHFDPEAKVWNSGPGIRHTYAVGPVIALGNVFFLQTIAVPIFGSNLPLWSLAYEFWYYALFPLLACGLGWAGNYPKILRIGQLVILMFILLILPPRLLAGGLIWLLGVGVYYYPKPQEKNANILGVAALLGFLAILLIYKGNIVRGFAGDCAVGLSFAILAAVLRGVSFPFGARIDHASRFLSEISYSLYVVHFPIMLCAMAIFHCGNQFEPDAAGLSIFAIWLVATLLASAGFWWIFEKRTQSIRKWISLMRKNEAGKVSTGLTASSKKINGG